MTEQQSRRLIHTYIEARDQFSPELLPQIFGPEAELEISLNTQPPSQPSIARGIEAISDILIHHFARFYEQPKTFCLDSPMLQQQDSQLSCHWLSIFREKQSHKIQISCGRYLYHLNHDLRPKITRLSIIYDQIVLISAKAYHQLKQWLDGLNYPWCSADEFYKNMPKIKEISPIYHYLKGYVNNQPLRLPL